MSDAKALKHSLGGFKTWFTIRCKGAIKKVDANKTSSHHKADLQTSLEEIKHSYDNVNMMLEKLLDLGEDVGSEIEETYEKYESHKDKLITAIESIPLPPDPQSRDPPSPSPRTSTITSNMHFKPNDTLKPFKLSMDSTPEALKEWVFQFRSFYSTSHLDTLNLEDQRTYFKICMNPDVYARIKDQIQSNTQIFGENGCIDLLEADYLRRYPLFKRRLNFHRSGHVEGEKFSNFLLRMSERANEAELETMSKDDMKVFNAICTCKDPILKEKFLKLEDPEYDDIVKTTEIYEQAQASIEALDTDRSGRAQSFNIQSSQRRRSHSKGPKKNKNYSNKKIYKCNCCGSEDHLLSQCKKRETTKCFKCGKMGHYAHLCKSSKSPKNNTNKTSTISQSQE